MAYGAVTFKPDRGVYQGIYKDAKGKRRYVSDKNKKLCISKLRKAEREVHAGIHTVAGDTVTFGVALDHWQAECDRRQRLGDLAAATVQNYRHVADKHVRPELGAVKLNRLTPPVCQALINTLNDRYRGTAETARKVIRGTLEFAVAQDWLTRNPLNDRKLKVIKRPAEVRTPTKEELRDLLEYINDGSTELAAIRRLMVVLGLFAGGMRKGEQCGLRWQDVDWSKGELHIKHGICGVTNALKGTKTKTSLRKVSIIPVVREGLRALWELQGRPKEGFVLRTADSGHIFKQHSHIWTMLMRDAGLCDHRLRPRFTPHALRHAAVALLHEQGVPLLEIARIVGHKALDLTIGTYAYIFRDAEDRATPAMTAAYESLVRTKRSFCDRGLRQVTYSELDQEQRDSAESPAPRSIEALSADGDIPPAGSARAKYT